MKRPRGGEVWRRRSDGRETRVAYRRTVNPMGSVRPHLDRESWWSLVFHDLSFAEHESDFLRAYEFVRRAP